MGREATCSCAFSWLDDGRRHDRKVLLESGEIVFRGNPRVKILFASIQRASVDGTARPTSDPAENTGDGELVIVCDAGEARLLLGPREAALWARKITSPPTLLDKLGVAANTRVTLLGATDAPWIRDLEQVVTHVSTTLRSTLDGVVILSVSTAADLLSVEPIAAAMSDVAALWIVYPRATQAIPERVVLEAGRRVGLTDNKTAKVSDALSSLRFVRPREARKRGRQ